MTLEEFKKRAQGEEDWAPGWDAIDEQFSKVYPGQEPSHFGTNLVARAMLGGDQYLDGYSVYTSPKGYKHLVTFGMSELYVNEEDFGGPWSKWGYEMTMKLPDTPDEDCMWAIDMLSNLARYTFTEERFFEPNQYVSGNGQPIKQGSDSRITGLIIVDDTEVDGTDTVYGRLAFMQLVGVTQRELEEIIRDPDQNIPLLLERMKADSPDFVTDLKRTKEYL